MEKKKSNVFGQILSFILALFVVFGLFSNAPLARAEESFNLFDQTDALEDLESSGTFNVNDYPWDYYGLYKSPSIANFVEWCYSPFKTEDFALYIYFYNPQNLKIDTDSVSNKVQMASAYSSYPITKDSVPTDYDNFSLVFCSMSSRENFEGLFYKFRVVDQKGSDGLYMRERVYSGERRYDVSGITLATEDGKVQEVGAGGTYFFNGFAAGYGPSSSSESTLVNTGYRTLDTISIEVHPTCYRQAGWSELGEGHQWDINSVYFSVPERYFRDYGNLQKIKAEWYEYETTDMLIANDKAAIDAFLPYAGVNISTYTPALGYSFVDNKESYKKVLRGYNLANHSLDVSGIMDSIYYDYYTLSEKINYFFYTGSQITSSSSVILLSSSKIREYMKSYNATFDNGYLPVELDGVKISADLFRTTLSNGRDVIAYVDDDVHHKVVEFDANDEFDMLAYDSTESGWDRFWRQLFGGVEVDSQNNVSPICADVSEYIELSDANLAKTLLISASEVSEFKTFYQTAKTKVNPERTVLFRFAKTDYKTQEVVTYKYKSEGILDKTTEKNALLTSQSVFFDFDILKLTFLDESGTYTAIPVVSDPLDIVNDVTSRPESSGGLLDTILNTIKDFFTMLGNVLGFAGVLLLGIAALVVLVWLFIQLLRLVKLIEIKVIKIILIVLLIVALALVLIFGLTFWIETLIATGGAVFV